MAAELVVAVIVLAIVSALLFQFGGRYVYNYRITNFGIEVVMLGRVPLKRVAFGNISEIKISSFKEMLPFKGVAFGNRIWGRTVLVRQKKGILRTIFITPDNPEQFVSQVSAHLAKSQKGENRIR